MASDKQVICKHAEIGSLEYNDDELADALSAGTEFWGDGTCLSCKRLVEFQIVRGTTRLVNLSSNEAEDAEVNHGK